MTQRKLISNEFASFLEKIQPIVIDLGARGDVDPDLLPYAWACKLIGFEPEPIEAQRLIKQGDSRWASFAIVPSAVGSKDGHMVLHLPLSEFGASLYAPNEKMIDMFGHEVYHRSIRTMDVETVTLATVVHQYNLPQIDYLKIDIEGAELDILRSMGESISCCLAVKVEVSFLEQRQGQSYAWDVMEYMKQNGYYLANIQNLFHWRRRPIPAHPYIARHTMPYSKGICSQCDLVFLKDITTIHDDEEAIRLSCMASLLGYFDYAVTVLRDRPSVAEQAIAKYSVDLEQEYQKISRHVGRRAVLAKLKSNLRQSIPLIRSLLTGLPTAATTRPY